ncbi:MAG: D-arabinono-1,4-lactone oxidase [Chloroflexota bacterium]
MMEQAKNWAGNIVYQATAVKYPTSIAELQEIVRQTPKLRVLGTRHSFNRIADTTAVHISLDKLPAKIDFNHQEKTVTVSGNLRYGDLCLAVAAEGYALHNMASLPHISVVGAIGTATHGSGSQNGNLATAVTALTLINAAGDLIELSRQRNGAQFDGMVVHLGNLGVIVHVTLVLLPTFSMRQFVYTNLPFEKVTTNFQTVMSSAYSVSLFTDWRGETINQLWLKERVDSRSALPQERFFDGVLAKRPYHPIDTAPAESCTEQMGVVGAWFERLPHFRMDFTPSFGEELQSEYFVPIESGAAALRAIHQIRDKIAPQLFISEIRTVAADGLWLSPCYQQDSAAIHFTWKPNLSEVYKILPEIERALLPFRVRPHWGKLFDLSGKYLHHIYPKLEDYRALIKQFDQKGKFQNAFIQEHI